MPGRDHRNANERRRRDRRSRRMETFVPRMVIPTVPLGPVTRNQGESDSTESHQARFPPPDANHHHDLRRGDRERNDEPRIEIHEVSNHRFLRTGLRRAPARDDLIRPVSTEPPGQFKRWRSFRHPQLLEPVRNGVSHGSERGRHHELEPVPMAAMSLSKKSIHRQRRDE